jgi:hypothetical protein
LNPRETLFSLSLKIAWFQYFMCGDKSTGFIMPHSSLRMGLLGGISTAFYASGVISAADTSAGDVDVLKYVDPLIGTANGG